MNSKNGLFFFLAISFLGLFAPSLLGQVSRAVDLDEKIFREEAKREGFSESAIDQLVQMRKGSARLGKNHNPESIPFINNSYPMAPFAICSGMSAENGWGAWQAQKGKYDLANSNPPAFGAPGAPAAPRFNLTSGGGQDQCTPNGGGPPIPVVAPGFGNTSIRLGEPLSCGITGACSPAGGGAGCAERLLYPLTVTPQDTNFVFAYALVIQNASGHTTVNQPYVEFMIIESDGDTVPCAYFRYTGDNLPDLYPVVANCTNPPGGCNKDAAFYKPWEVVGVNLSAYVGQTLNVVITNVDCRLGGHYAYSYWDFSCGAFRTDPASYCLGQSVTITAPSNPLINYNYLWSPGGQTTQTIVVQPQPGDTFIVKMGPPSGCDFYIRYVPEPMGALANFNFTADCNGKVVFTDSSAGPNGTGTPIVGWNWSFPGGAPSFSTLQHPIVTYPPGTYTVTLVVTSQGGCKDTMVRSLTIPGPQSISTTAVDEICRNCEGSASVTNSGGTPPYTILWSDSSGSTTADISNLCSGTYGVTVTDANGCVITSTAVIGKQGIIPIASFYPDPSEVFIMNPVINFFDKSSDAISWEWDFGDSSTSILQNPIHKYADTGCYIVTLMVENQYGCRDTIPERVCVRDISSIYIPNAFTPNKDGKNEWFTVGEYNYCEFEMFIFDRWGNLIYQTTSLKGWDGTANNGSEFVQEDVYVWLVKAVDCYGKVWRRVGHVTVIR